MTSRCIYRICGLAMSTRHIPRLTSSGTALRKLLKSSCKPVRNISNTARQVSITKTLSSHESLEIGFQDDLASDFQFIWLRDNCPCIQCIDPISRQKKLDTVQLDVNPKVQSFELTERGQLQIKWADGHISVYDQRWLHKYAKGFELESHDNSQENLPKMETWDSETIQNINPEVSYEEVMETEEGLKKWLFMIYKFGLARMKGVPLQKGEVVKVIERSAFVKRTKWGMSFDVLCEPVQNDPKHLAYTGMHLEGHTDMNYLKNSPGLQALHCLKANPASEGDSVGGKSTFVDGFHISKWLRKEHPSSFKVLNTTLVDFKIHSHNMDYSNSEFILSTRKNGDLKEIHYNTRTMAPLQGPKDAVLPFYRGYKLFGLKMREPASQFAFNLVPGDLVAFNNRRILHGRTSFDPTRMHRHLEGCYGDMDEFITRVKAFSKERAHE